jgi:hypothetical protein
VGLFVKINQGNLSRNKKNEDEPEAVSSVPVKICAPALKNSVLQQSRTVTGLNVWIAASVSMGYALCMVIGAILVVSNLLKKTRRIRQQLTLPQ